MATKGMTLFMYFFSSGSAPNSFAITLLSGRAALLLYTHTRIRRKRQVTQSDRHLDSHESPDHWMGKWVYVTSLDVIASPCNAFWVRIRHCAATVGSSWPHRWCSGRVSPELWNHPSMPLKNTHTKKHFRLCSCMWHHVGGPCALITKGKCVRFWTAKTRICELILCDGCQTHSGSH